VPCNVTSRIKKPRPLDRGSALARGRCRGGGALALTKCWYAQRSDDASSGGFLRYSITLALQGTRPTWTGAASACPALSFAGANLYGLC
jgi:hypothetical protein